MLNTDLYNLMELTVALRLLNLPGHYYEVQRSSAGPNHSGAGVISATYADETLVVRTNQGEISVHFPQLILTPAGRVRVYQDWDFERPVMVLTIARIGARFTKELTAARARLNRH